MPQLAFRQPSQKRFDRLASRMSDQALCRPEPQCDQKCRHLRKPSDHHALGSALRLRRRHLLQARPVSRLMRMRDAGQPKSLLTSDDGLNEKIKRLPQKFSDALACDWSLWSSSLAAARAAFVVGRGFGLGSAREIGLKVTETMRLPTLSYSAAEVMHGPLACASAEIPFLVLRQNDGSSAMVDALIAELRVRKLNVFSAGDPTGVLPWIENDDPICDAITMLLPAYATIEQAARARGFDPDNPPNLSKVTETM